MLLGLVGISEPAKPNRKAGTHRRRVKCAPNLETAHWHVLASSRWDPLAATHPAVPFSRQLEGKHTHKTKRKEKKLTVQKGKGKRAKRYKNATTASVSASSQPPRRRSRPKVSNAADPSSRGETRQRESNVASLHLLSSR
ncbi:hypothetical protein VPH35_061936 [Triticum aestivum]